MLILRDSFIREKFNKKNEWKNVNDDQYVFSKCDEEELYNKMFPIKKDLEEFYEYRKEWFERASKCLSGTKPLSVNCELVSTCNLACTMCYTITEKFQNSVVGAQRMLPWKIVKKIIDEVAENQIPSISFSWRGESTLYRDCDEEGNTITFADVLKYARKKGVLEITCLTHGQLIDEKMAEEIVDAKPTWINFSIDGLEKNYNKIRTPANKIGTSHNAFQEVVKAIKRLVKFKKIKNSTRPVIRTNTIFPAVKEDFDEYSKFFMKIGVDMITVNEIYDVRHRSAPESLIRKDWYCQYPFQRLTVSANGILLPCTGAVNEEINLVLGKIEGSANKSVKDYSGSVVEKDMENFSIMAAWGSKKLENIRFLHKNLRRTEIEPGCKNCHLGQVKEGYQKIPVEWDTKNLKWQHHHTISTKARYKNRASR